MRLIAFLLYLLVFSSSVPVAAQDSLWVEFQHRDFPIELSYPAFYEVRHDNKFNTESDSTNCSGIISLHHTYADSNEEYAVELSTHYKIILSGVEYPKELEKEKLHYKNGIWFAEGFTYSPEPEFEMEEVALGHWKAQYAIVPARYYYVDNGLATAAGEAERYLIEKELSSTCKAYVIIAAWGEIDEVTAIQILGSIRTR